MAFSGPWPPTSVAAHIFPCSTSCTHSSIKTERKRSPPPLTSKHYTAPLWRGRKSCRCPAGPEILKRANGPISFLSMRQNYHGRQTPQDAGPQQIMPKEFCKVLSGVGRGIEGPLGHWFPIRCFMVNSSIHNSFAQKVGRVRIKKKIKQHYLFIFYNSGNAKNGTNSDV